MTILPQVSLSGGRPSSGEGGIAPVCYTPPYNLFTYITYFLSYFNSELFPMVPTVRSALMAPFGRASRDTAVGAWQIWTKHQGTHGVSTLNAAFRETEF